MDHISQIDSYSDTITAANQRSGCWRVGPILELAPPTRGANDEKALDHRGAAELRACRGGQRPQQRQFAEYPTESRSRAGECASTDGSDPGAPPSGGNTAALHH